MTTLTETTTRLRAEGRTAVVPFLTAGYPDRATFRRLVGAAAAAGVRILEIGVPFSDPVADGPAIQAASQVALRGGMTLAGALQEAARAAGDHGLRPVLMGYLNPLLAYGPERFAADCAAHGVSGLIVPDLPLEEAAGLRTLLRSHDVSLVELVAPTSGAQRLAAYAEDASGFLYLVSTTGVTGGDVGRDLAGYVGRVRGHCDLPLYVGFGIADADGAARVAEVADGVVIGSALQRVIAGADSAERAVTAVTEFLAEVRAAVAAADGKHTGEPR